MKTRTLIHTLLALVCLVVLTTVTTSCSDDEDETAGMVAYSIDISGNFDLTDSSVWSILAEMRSALTDAVGSGTLVKRDDAKAIQACDAAYQRTKSQATSSFTLVLQRGEPSSDPYAEATTLKAYSY